MVSNEDRQKAAKATQERGAQETQKAKEIQKNIENRYGLAQNTRGYNYSQVTPDGSIQGRDPQTGAYYYDQRTQQRQGNIPNDMAQKIESQAVKREIVGDIQQQIKAAEQARDKNVADYIAKAKAGGMNSAEQRAVSDTTRTLNETIKNLKEQTASLKESGKSTPQYSGVMTTSGKIYESTAEAARQGATVAKTRTGKDVTFEGDIRSTAGYGQSNRGYGDSLTKTGKVPVQADYTSPGYQQSETGFPKVTNDNIILNRTGKGTPADPFKSSQPEESALAGFANPTWTVNTPSGQKTFQDKKDLEAYVKSGGEIIQSEEKLSPYNDNFITRKFSNVQSYPVVGPDGKTRYFKSEESAQKYMQKNELGFADGKAIQGPPNVKYEPVIGPYGNLTFTYGKQPKTEFNKLLESTYNTIDTWNVNLQKTEPKHWGKILKDFAPFLTGATKFGLSIGAGIINISEQTVDPWLAKNAPFLAKIPTNKLSTTPKNQPITFKSESPDMALLPYNLEKGVWRGTEKPFFGGTFSDIPLVIEGTKKNVDQYIKKHGSGEIISGGYLGYVWGAGQVVKAISPFKIVKESVPITSKTSAKVIAPKVEKNAVPNTITKRGKVLEEEEIKTKIKLVVPEGIKTLATPFPIRVTKVPILTEKGEEGFTAVSLGYGSATVPIGGKYKGGNFYRGSAGYDESGIADLRGASGKTSFDTYELAHYTDPQIRQLRPLVKEGERQGRFTKDQFEQVIKERDVVLEANRKQGIVKTTNKFDIGEKMGIDLGIEEGFISKTAEKKGILGKIHYGIKEKETAARFGEAQRKGFLGEGKGSFVLNLLEANKENKSGKLSFIDKLRGKQKGYTPAPKEPVQTITGDIDVMAVTDPKGKEAQKIIISAGAKEGFELVESGKGVGIQKIDTPETEQEIFNIITSKEQIKSELEGVNPAKFYGKEIKNKKIILKVPETKEKITTQGFIKQLSNNVGSISGFMDRNTLKNFRDWTPELEAKMFPDSNIKTNIGKPLPHRQKDTVRSQYFGFRELARMAWEARDKPFARRIGQTMKGRYEMDKGVINWPEEIKKLKQSGEMEFDVVGKTNKEKLSDSVSIGVSSASETGRIGTKLLLVSSNDRNTSPRNTSQFTRPVFSPRSRSILSSSISPKSSFLKSPSPRSPNPKSPSVFSPSPKSPSTKSPLTKSPNITSPSPKSPSPRSPYPKSPSPKSPSPKSPSPRSPSPSIMPPPSTTSLIPPKPSTLFPPVRRPPMLFGGDIKNKEKKDKLYKRKHIDFLGNTKTNAIEGLFRRTEIITGDKRTEKQVIKDKKATFNPKYGLGFSNKKKLKL